MAVAGFSASGLLAHVAEKTKRLSLPRGKKHLNRFPVLIYAGEIEPVVEKTDFFRSRIDFATLLEKEAAP